LKPPRRRSHRPPHGGDHGPPVSGAPTAYLGCGADLGPGAAAGGRVAGAPLRAFLDEWPECRRHVLEVSRQPLEESLTRIPFGGRPGSQSICRVHTAGDGRERFGPRWVATSHHGGGCPAASLRPPPFQPRQPSRALRLTSGHTWSTDTPSVTCLSGASSGLLSVYAPAAGMAVPEGLSYALPTLRR
jgi:hypothetical protein